jgi:predicted sugar kinase
MLPAAQAGNFHDFAASVHRFGWFAGGCFAYVQGGPYARTAAPIIDRLRQLGIAGVAQSSWGPSVLALAESAADARRIRRELENDPVTKGAEIIISRPDNRGAVIL